MLLRARSWQDGSGVPAGVGAIVMADRGLDACLPLAVHRPVTLAVPDAAARAMAELQRVACARPLLETRQLLGLDLLGRRVHLLHQVRGAMSAEAQAWWGKHEHLVREGALSSGALEAALSLPGLLRVGAGSASRRRAGVALLAAHASPGARGRALRAVCDAGQLRRAMSADHSDAVWMRTGTWSAQDSPRWLRPEGQAQRDAAAQVAWWEADSTESFEGAVVGLESDLGPALVERVDPRGWVLVRAPRPGEAPWSPGGSWRVDEAGTAQARAADRTVIFGPVTLYRRASSVPGRAR
jgi:hypothetical protein